VDRTRATNLLVRGLLLFALSIVLVFGFWEHRNFYQVGLYNLLLIGGFVTFLVVLAFRVAWKGELPRLRAKGRLAFTRDESELLLRKALDVTLLPLATPDPPTVGQVVRATYETGREFGRVLVLDATRKLLMDLTDDEARGAGYRTATELRQSAAIRLHSRDNDVVTVLRIRAVGVGG
jgi:hypothetical protein